MEWSHHLRDLQQATTDHERILACSKMKETMTMKRDVSLSLSDTDSVLGAMHKCETPLALHALQQHLRHLITWCPNSTADEIEQQASAIRCVFETLLRCFKEVDAVPSQICMLRALSMLDLCSSLLKTVKPPKHSELEGSYAPSAEGHFDNVQRRCMKRDGSITETCAKFALEFSRTLLEEAWTCSGRLISAGSAGGARTLNRRGETHDGRKTTSHHDVIFWTLTLECNILKCVRRTRCLDVRSPVNVLPAAGDIGASVRTEEEHCRTLIAQLVPVIVGDEVALMDDMPDVVLKWIELVEAVLDVAGALTSGALALIFVKVPSVLQHLKPVQTFGLKLASSSCRLPGSSFVEVEGASEVVLQAAIGLLLRLVKMQVQGPLRSVPLIHRCQTSPKSKRPEEETHPSTWPEAKDLASRSREEWRTVPDSVQAMVTLSAGCCDTRDGLAQELVCLFIDQDDALVDMLLHNLQIYTSINFQAAGGDIEQHLSTNEAALIDLYKHRLHPATLFSVLTSKIGYNAEVLLDWLISPETSFLEYLTRMTRMAAADWSGFVINVTGAGESQCRDTSDHDSTHGDTSVHEEELVLSDAEAQVLSSVVGCLRAIASKIRDLARRKLIPFDLTPLLKRIDILGDLYDGCHEAEDEDAASVSDEDQNGSALTAAKMPSLV